jgi:hypothetical protein
VWDRGTHFEKLVGIVICYLMKHYNVQVSISVSDFLSTLYETYLFLSYRKCVHQNLSLFVCLFIYLFIYLCMDTQGIRLVTDLVSFGPDSHFIERMWGIK